MNFWQALEQMKLGKRVTSNKSDNEYMYMENGEMHSSGLDEWDYRYDIKISSIGVWCLFATNWRVIA